MHAKDIPNMIVLTESYNPCLLNVVGFLMRSGVMKHWPCMC